MRKLAFGLPLLFFVYNLRAEVYTLTLAQAVEQALKQNPDITYARLNEVKASQAVRVAKDPFTPQIAVGSGLAYTNGFPMSIEGAAPSIVQANARQFLFNREQSYVIARTKEEARGAGIATAAKKDEIAYRTTELYLDAERATRVSDMALKQVDSLAKVLDVVKTRVQEGRELPLEAKRAELNLAKARQTLENARSDQVVSETALATVLGYSADDRVRPAEQERTAPEVPLSEEAAVKSAVQSNQGLRQFESQIAAKGLQIRADRATRLPRVDLVAQYGLFAKFNNYEQFFQHFQRNNGQLGIALQIPVLPGPGIDAMTQQSEAEIAQLRLQMNSTRNRIILDTRQSYQQIQKAETAREVAKLDLEVAREQLSVILAQVQEGRASLRQVEEARIAENEKWIAFYDSQYALEKAKWNLLRETGELMAAIK